MGDEFKRIVANVINWVSKNEKTKFRPVIKGESGALYKRSEHILEFVPMMPSEKVAKNLYLEFSQRNKKDVINKICSAGNFSYEDAAEIYNHVFEEKHLTLDRKGRQVYEYFDPDPEMAQAFNRILNSNKILENDIMLLKHELYERMLMKNNPEMIYYEAHKLVSKKYPWKGGD